MKELSLSSDQKQHHKQNNGKRKELDHKNGLTSLLKYTGKEIMNTNQLSSVLLEQFQNLKAILDSCPNELDESKNNSSTNNIDIDGVLNSSICYLDGFSKTSAQLPAFTEDTKKYYTDVETHCTLQQMLLKLQYPMNSQPKWKETTQMTDQLELQKQESKPPQHNYVVSKKQPQEDTPSSPLSNDSSFQSYSIMPLDLNEVPLDLNEVPEELEYPTSPVTPPAIDLNSPLPEVPADDNLAVVSATSASNNSNNNTSKNQEDLKQLVNTSNTVQTKEPVTTKEILHTKLLQKQQQQLKQNPWFLPHQCKNVQNKRPLTQVDLTSAPDPVPKKPRATPVINNIPPPPPPQPCTHEELIFKRLKHEVVHKAFELRTERTWLVFWEECSQHYLQNFITRMTVRDKLFEVLNKEYPTVFQKNPTNPEIRMVVPPRFEHFRAVNPPTANTAALAQPAPATTSLPTTTGQKSKSNTTQTRPSSNVYRQQWADLQVPQARTPSPPNTKNTTAPVQPVPVASSGSWTTNATTQPTNSQSIPKRPSSAPSPTQPHMSQEALHQLQGERWILQYQKLRQYKLALGYAWIGLPQATLPEWKEVANWAGIQRNLRKMNLLHPLQIALLDQIEFNWSIT